MTRSRATTLVALIALGAASWWLAGGRGPTPSVELAPPQPSPGYYLLDATLEQTDADGLSRLVAHAARAAQQDEHGTVALETPTVRYRAATGREWLMTAERGLLPGGRSVIDLDGDVTLRSPAAGAALVRTEHLELDVPAQVATTAEPVRIEMPPHALLARGLRADLTQETLRLEADVHGTFTR